MEEGDKTSGKTPEAGVGPENQKEPRQHRDSTSDFKKNLRMRINEEKTELKLIDNQKINNLLKESGTLVTNIGTAAKANDLLRRTELEEARKRRFEQLQNEVKITQEKFDEVTRGWSEARQIVIPQDLEEAINRQKELCDAIIDDKKKLVDDLQNELRIRDDCYVKDLKRQEEELGMLVERMEDQIKTMTNAYREELAQLERIYQQEIEVLLTRDQTDWEQYMKELLEKELREMPLRRKKVENYELKIHSLMLDNTCKYSLIQIERSDQAQVVERDHQKIKATRMIATLKQIKQEDQIVVNTFNLASMMRRTRSMEAELRNLLAQYSSQERQFKDRSQFLSDDYKRNIQQYERIQKQIKHFAAADVRKFTDMWLMVEAEVKQLVENALVIDSLICKELGLAWERPYIPFMEVSGPIQPKKRASRRNKRVSDGAVVPNGENDRDGAPTDSQEGSVSSTEEWEKMLMETVTELLFDEAGFLMDDKLLNLGDSTGKGEEAVKKLDFLLRSLGLEKEDLRKLAHFIHQFNLEYRERTQPVVVEADESSDQVTKGKSSSTTHGTPELIDPNMLLPALKSFLEQVSKSRSSSAQTHPCLQQVKARDASEDEAYWEGLGNVISEDKLKLWDAAEKALTQYHGVLREISELVDETQGLEQQNAELRILLQTAIETSTSGK